VKPKFIKAYMDVAQRFSELSSAKRLKVGAIVVKDDRIISIGYNGMPAGWDNECEKRVYIDPSKLSRNCGYVYLDEDGSSYELKTKPEVIHAEANAIAKLAKGNESGEGSKMFLTHAPCIDCAKQMYAAGVNMVFYKNSYRDTQGVDFLEKCGINVVKVISPGETVVGHK
jgi:dCMP deaminase